MRASARRSFSEGTVTRRGPTFSPRSGSNSRRRDLGDSLSLARIDLCNQVLALDPTQRGIGTAEQYRRSLMVLRRTLEEMYGCTGSPATQPLQWLTDTARTGLERQTPARRLHDAAEVNLDLAARLWQARQKTCTESAPQSDRALILVLEKAAE